MTIERASSVPGWTQCNRWHRRRTWRHWTPLHDAGFLLLAESTDTIVTRSFVRRPICRHLWRYFV